MVEYTVAPPEFPVVEIGGRKLAVKSDFLSIVRMSALGINQQDLRSLFQAASAVERSDPTVIWNIIRLWSCMVAGNYIDRDNPSAPSTIPTPEYWASVIGDDLNKWDDICSAVVKAYLKAMPLVTGAAPAGTKNAPVLT